MQDEILNIMHDRVSQVIKQIMNIDFVYDRRESKK